ncbi:hypothetical protein BGZ68_007730 [Mortierella alpina]|nr:hypothetical protein BGZ68_007730 [Mortierella alpina]
MRFDFLALVLVALVAPALAVKTWDINIRPDGKFSPPSLTIMPGDTVRWPNTNGGSHAIVQTDASGSCKSMVSGFNSGSLAANKAYQRVFSSPAVIYYKDGVGANCKSKLAVGTIFVGQKRSVAPGTATVTTAVASETTRSSNTATRAALPIIATSSPRSSATSAFSNGESLLLGAACFLGLIVGM